MDECFDEELEDMIKKQIEDQNPKYVSEAYHFLKKLGLEDNRIIDLFVDIYMECLLSVIGKGQSFKDTEYEKKIEDLCHIYKQAETKIIREIQNQFYELYDCDEKKAIDYILSQWPVIKKQIISYHIHDLYELDEKTHYIFEFQSFLEDIELLLGNEKKAQELLDFCSDILEIFDQDLYLSNYKNALGEALGLLGRIEESDDYFQSLIQKNDEDIDYINGYLNALIERKEIEKAETLLKHYFKEDEPITFDNDLLYYRAIDLYHLKGQDDKAYALEKKIDHFIDLIELTDE